MLTLVKHRMVNLGRQLNTTWLHPRYIGTVYMRPALVQASEFAQGTLLDIGCGRRQYQPIFAERVTRYLGLDWPQLFERARPDIIGDAMRLPVADRAVDTVLATELMEHLPDPDQFLSEVARVLRPGGRLILSVPFMEPLHEEPRDYYRFTPYSLRVLLERHSFTIEQLWPKGGWWSVVLGSFVNQSIYDWAAPPGADGRRRYTALTVLALPVCSAAQFLGYMLDKVFKSPTYTLGYVAVARLSEAS